MLFNFRNVLGHGREVLARHVAGAAVSGGFREDFSGSYRVVEDYLRKEKLVTRRFVQAHSEFVFLSDPIADHFFGLATSLPEAVLSSLPEEEEGPCRKALEYTEGDPDGER